MAVREIKTEKFDILGKPWTGSIKFESKNESFFMNLPKEISEKTGRRTVQAGTLEELREDFKSAINEYGELIKTSRKIIAFRAKSKLKKEDGHPGETREGYSGIFGQRSSVFEGQLELAFAVGMEAKRGGRLEYKDLNGSRFDDDLISWSGSPKYGTRVVDWTAEREAFFRSMIDSIERAKEKMDKLFDHEETETILGIIDSGGAGLLSFEAKP